jgi:fumarate reductase subunit D
LPTLAAGDGNTWAGVLSDTDAKFWEAVVTSGLILLALLAIIVAFFWTRIRRKAGLSVTGRHWIAAIVVFALVVLALYATAQQ